MSATPMFRSHEVRGRHEKRKEDLVQQKAMQREALKWKKADEARFKDDSHFFIDPSMSKRHSIQETPAYPSLTGRVVDMLRGSFSLSPPSNAAAMQQLAKQSNEHLLLSTKPFADAHVQSDMNKPRSQSVSEYFRFPKSTDYFVDASKQSAHQQSMPQVYY